MKLKYLKLTIFIAIYIFINAILLIFKPSIESSMGIWATIITGLILIWYTWETMELRRIASKQLDLQLQPLVIYKNDGKHEIENIGNSVAMNVSIDPIQKGNSEYLMEIKFIDFTTTLKPNQTKNLETKVFLNGEEISNINSVHLNMKYSNDESILKINFENHIGEKFFVRQSINRNKVKILETKRE